MEITNLQQYKNYLDSYYSSSQYFYDIDDALDGAYTALDNGLKNLPTGKKPAVCLDIDETMISEYDLMKANDYGFPYDWLLIAWQKTDFPALEAVLDFYDYCLVNKVYIFVISSRTTNYQDTVSLLLENAGYTNTSNIYLKNENDKRTTEQFKTDTRLKLIASGYDILVNIGDQVGDLNGAADYQCKLPNPFYE